MIQLKVKKKDPIITNVIIYLLLSLLFLFLQYAYRHQISPFSLTYIKKSIQLFWFVAIPVCGAIYLIWKHHRLAKSFYVFSIGLITFFVIQGLFIKFNKILVVALFFYIVISYFLYQLISYYFSLSYLNSNYSESDLFEPILRNIKCKIITDNDEVECELTNWDDEGCFIKMNSPLMLEGNVKIKVEFADREFYQNGEVVAQSTDLSGVGLKLNKSSKDLNIFNWSEFIELINELGFEPERLR
ncbi:MAG: hypothetical protein AB7R69_05955 [Candidatus Babeliales bacterium]